MPNFLLKRFTVATFTSLQYMVSQETYDDIKQKYDELEAKYESNLVYINYLQRHLFGKTSERHVPSPVNDLQGSLFPNEALS